MAKIVGVGALLADLILPIDDSYLLRVKGEKGGMEYVSNEQIQAWLADSRHAPQPVPGGSTANLLRGLAHFGESCSLVTKLGCDPLSRTLAQDLQSHHIALIGLQSDLPTGRVLSFVTPDGQRTMRTYLGAASIWDANELRADPFANAELVHLEGFTLVHQGLTQKAAQIAKTAGAQLSFNLSSFEVATTYKEEIAQLIAQYVDVLFANEVEALHLTGSDAEKACTFLKDICRTVVITMGRKGCWIGHEGIMYRCPAYPVEPLDTTGAGDLFMSGFLHGFLQEMAMPECAHIGAIAAREVVQVQGTSLSEETWEQIKKDINQ